MGKNMVTIVIKEKIILIWNKFIMKDTILFGDCRETLKQFDEKPRMCVTSPPYYGLRTKDIISAGKKEVSTSQMGDAIISKLQ